MHASKQTNTFRGASECELVLKCAVTVSRACGMQQGTFKRDSAVAAEKRLGIEADELLPQITSRKVKDTSAVVGAGGAPAPDTFKNLIVYPPLQKFLLDTKTYLIVNEDNLLVKEYDKSGYWLVPCVLDKDDSGAEIVRPENVTEKLPHALMSEDWGTEYDDMTPIPNREYARLHIDFSPTYLHTMKIGALYIKTILETAEQMEYSFALRMQGLLNCGINAVWTCTEFGFDNADRGHIMEQFLQKYIGRFLSQVSQQQQEIDPDKIVREAIQMHNRFSEGWTKEHKKGLAPNLDACSEALVSQFCTGPLRILVDAGLTRKQIARFLRRSEIFSPQFSLCLHYFMVKMDQDKNGRNANYKSMFNSTNAQILQMKTLDAFLRANINHIEEHGKYVMGLTKDEKLFDTFIVDWYYIQSQLHAPTVQYTGVKRQRARMARSAPGAFFQQT